MVKHEGLQLRADILESMLNTLRRSWAPNKKNGSNSSALHLLPESADRLTRVTNYKKANETSIFHSSSWICDKKQRQTHTKKNEKVWTRTATAQQGRKSLRHMALIRKLFNDICVK